MASSGAGLENATDSECERVGQFVGSAGWARSPLAPPPGPANRGGGCGTEKRSMCDEAHGVWLSPPLLSEVS